MFQGTKAVKTLFYINVITFILFSILDILHIPLMGLFCAWGWDTPNFMPFQLISYQFLHAGLFHILFNMLALLSLGAPVENFLGSTKFYIYYLICGIMSALLHISMVGGSSPLVGASGSIWGIVAMFALILPNEKLSFMFIPYGIKAKYLIGILFGIELSFCLFSLLTKVDSGVSHWGHVGGALTGSLFFLYEKFIAKNPN
jgi:membrane associated rhomboid family serine protease